MGDMENIGAALFVAASLGMTGIILVERFASNLAPPFLLFWMVGTVGICMVAVGGSR
jgi:hypothetical protein